MNKLFFVFLSAFLLLCVKVDARYSKTTGFQTGGGNCHFVCTEYDRDANGYPTNTTFEEWNAPCDAIPGAQIYFIRKFSITTEIINGHPVAIGLTLMTCEDYNPFDENGDVCTNPLTDVEQQEILQHVNEIFAADNL